MFFSDRSGRAPLYQSRLRRELLSVSGFLEEFRESGFDAIKLSFAVGQLRKGTESLHVKA